MGALAALSLRREVRFFVVDPDYYAWSLQQRAFRLTAPSTAHLLVQYVSSINTAKLVEYVRALTNHAKGRKQYNFRLVAPSVAFDLTSYGNNAVSPFGMTKAIPIILEAAITQLRPPVLYLGAGHVDWKVSLPVEKFIAATGSPVVDLAG
ncbi:hypothetical protein IWQ60_006771 [Tieghemiomyces parasiticus]|uniref:YbaK/aminoacyl-tRNA synthetase-associated domain-containing protein n=1 Tax=Tieghemiomyces parasiticus TaxID=78921 RepID=A0A9W8A5E3_9FUNG|nr:hypothetical protein IWQ60_006771 [Tieghemiomyces parasiticus]